MSLVQKVRDITNVTSADVSDSQIVTFLNAGAIFMLNSIPKALLGFLAEDSSNIVNSSGFDVDNDRVYSVRRNGIVCDEILDTDSYAYESTVVTATSLKKGSNIFPKYYWRNGKVYIKPDPTASQVGIVSEINIPTIAVATTTTTLDELENPMLLYASSLASAALANVWAYKSISDATNTSSDYSDALDKAKYLIDDAAQLSQGEDAEHWLNNEDPEMVATVIQIAAQEINRALAALRDSEVLSQVVLNSMQQEILRSESFLKRANEEIDRYIQSNMRLIGLSRKDEPNA